MEVTGIKMRDASQPVGYHRKCPKSLKFRFTMALAYPTVSPMKKGTVAAVIRMYAAAAKP
jgi:hypothetical protein